MGRRLVCLVCIIALAAPAWPAGRDDILIADFEGPDYGEWRVQGEAFGPGPARGTLPRQMRVSGYLGKGLVNSYFKGDGTPGTLASPQFTIQRRYLNFLIGGGGYEGTTCMNLLLDGKVVRTAAGPNIRPGGSERLSWRSWDVTDLADREVVVQIVDARTGGWGHINVDHIMQSDHKREEKPTMREIAISKRYLLLPVTNDAAKRRMEFRCGEDTVRAFDIELAEGEPDFRVFVDVRAFAGRELTIHVDRLPEGSKALSAIEQSDELPDAHELYDEPMRPQFHFSQRRGWNNDPNGMVYRDGEWHLFFQHNPYGWKWANI